MGARKKYGPLGLFLNSSEALWAHNTSIPERFQDWPGVEPLRDRVVAANLVAAYRAMGMRMDQPRMSRMCYRVTDGRKYGVRTRTQALDLANVLETVYGVSVNFKDFL